MFSDLKRVPNLEKAIYNLPKNSIIIFREYSLKKDKRQELALKFLKIAKKLNHKFFVGKDSKMALEIKADGVHYSDLDQNSWQLIKKKYPHKFSISLACHDFKSIQKAQNSNAEILFLSPIFKTKSHENAKNLGLLKLVKSCKYSSKKVFALGGVNSQNIGKVLKNYADGFAGIEIFADF
jgi:thiamine-phosphate pyrophosphorylase